MVSDITEVKLGTLVQTKDMVVHLLKDPSKHKMACNKVSSKPKFTMNLVPLKFVTCNNCIKSRFYKSKK